MAHANERIYLQRFLDDFPLGNIDGRILNVGALVGPDYRALFPGREIVGVDARPGSDITCDLTGNCAELGEERFAAVLCCSVLEHCLRPWLLAANLERLLKPAGLLYLTVPWIWRYHRYPDDYWRMSAAGAVSLFSEIHWTRKAYMTQATNEFLAVGKQYDTPPWRTADVSGRVMLCSQLLCMIGRKR